MRALRVPACAPPSARALTRRWISTHEPGNFGRGFWQSCSGNPPAVRDLAPLPVTWDPPGPDVVASTMDPELISALRTLRSRQRAALWLRYCDDLSTEDVARTMSCRTSAPLTRGVLGMADLLRRREAPCLTSSPPAQLAVEPAATTSAKSSARPPGRSPCR